MWMELGDAERVALIGLLGGVVLGLAARLGRFCTLGAIEDALYGGSDHRLRMWGLAIGAAMAASFALIAAGRIEIAEISYLSEGWNPIAHAAGGLLFGYGMAIAGNCGFGALARLGGGDLRSFLIVLVMGISGYVVMSGPLAGARLALFPPDLLPTDGPAGLAHLAERASGLPAAGWGIATGALIFALALASRSFLREPGAILWGTAVGLAVAGAWAGTQWVATESFGAVEVTSFTFVAPLGESILYAMTASGATLSFAVGSVAGVWLGALAGAMIRGLFRWEACDDARELRRQIFGAAMMGAGAVTALGCSIGQGISAFSVLAYGAPVTLLAIFAGAALGLRHLISGYVSA